MLQLCIVLGFSCASAKSFFLFVLEILSINVEGFPFCLLIVTR